MHLYRSAAIFSVLALLTVMASTARAVTITYSSNPFGGSLSSPPLLIAGTSSSGSFGLTTGIHETETVWAYFEFVNPTTTFSNLPYTLGLTLDGVAGSVPILASGVADSGQYSFEPDGTADFDIPGIGIIDVTALAAVTSINNPADAGPTQADFFLEPTAVPEPASLALFGVGFGGIAVARRRRRSGRIVSQA
jgi:PEP-CTERM motif